MRQAGLRLLWLAAFGLCASCGGSDGATNIGGLTPDEAAQLNNAAEMLDASADDMTLPPENANASVPAKAVP